MTRNVDSDVNSFKGISGKDYIIYPTLSTKRFEVFESLQIQTEHSTTISAFKNEALRAYNLFDQGKFASGSTVLHNIVAGTERIINKQPHPVLMICALFMCANDEDQAAWSEADAQEKIADWADIDVAFFLRRAKILVTRFMGGYDSDSQTFSAEEAEESE